MTEKFSKILFYDKTLDNIIGILFEREFFRNKILNNEFNIKNIFRRRLLYLSGLKFLMCLKNFRKNIHIWRLLLMDMEER